MVYCPTFFTKTSGSEEAQPAPRLRLARRRLGILIEILMQERFIPAASVVVRRTKSEDEA